MWNWRRCCPSGKGCLGKTSPAKRADILLKIADRLEANLELLAVAKTWKWQTCSCNTGGRVWTNCHHIYSAHAVFGDYKQSGIGRENHKMMLEHYQQTKNLLVGYSPKALGFF